MARIAALDTFAVGVTAPGDSDDVDFVSRFFAPAKGVPEDPVTGSLHCTLVPYWAERLGKTRLSARQVSARGGELSCTLSGSRVELGGHAVLVLEGKLRF
jgi:predicted PhzF superfamily epimerase YddE/YHI9